MKPLSEMWMKLFPGNTTWRLTVMVSSEAGWFVLSVYFCACWKFSIIRFQQYPLVIIRNEFHSRGMWETYSNSMTECQPLRARRQSLKVTNKNSSVSFQESASSSEPWGRDGSQASEVTHISPELLLSGTCDAPSVWALGKHVCSVKEAVGLKDIWGAELPTQALPVSKSGQP